MGERFTQSAQSKELVRAGDLHRALEHGPMPTFIPPSIPNSVAQPSSLSWNSLEPTPGVANPQETLEVRRHYLEQLFESSPDALVLVDATFRAQCVNREFERMFGYPASQTLGQPVDSFILPAGRAAESDWITQCLQRGEQLTLETQRRDCNGALLDVSISTAPLIIDGRPAAYYAIYRDISDRKRAETLSSALYRIAEKAGASQNLQQFFAAIHGIVDELLCARNFSIAIHDSESQLLSYPYFVDEQESAPAPAKLGSGLTDFVMRTGEPVLCTPELLRQLRMSGEVEITGTRALDWLGIPLKVNQSRFRRAHRQKLFRKRPLQ